MIVARHKESHNLRVLFLYDLKASFGIVIHFLVCSHDLPPLRCAELFVLHSGALIFFCVPTFLSL